jgi:hypothetical protein
MGPEMETPRPSEVLPDRNLHRDRAPPTLAVDIATTLPFSAVLPLGTLTSFGLLSMCTVCFSLLPLPSNSTITSATVDEPGVVDSRSGFCEANRSSLASNLSAFSSPLSLAISFEETAKQNEAKNIYLENNYF